MAKKKEKTLEEKLQEALVPENQWPYILPENWCWTRLGKITNVVGGGTPSSSKKEYYDNGTIPWLSPADLSGYSDIYISRGQKNITELGLSKSSARLMPKDTVLLSSRAPIGYVAIANNAISTNQGFKNFLPSDAFYSRFLYWYLKSSKSLLESYASGTTFLELSGSKASIVEYPLPPLTEQKRIVHRIESLFAKLDEAKEKIQQVLDGAEMRKAAILHIAFTGELTKNWRKENGISEDSWKLKKIGDIFNLFSGKGFKASEYTTNGIKLLRISNVSYGSFDWEDTKYLPYEYKEIEKKLLLRENDILIALNRPITNGKLKICLIDNNEEYILYQRVGCMRCKEDVLLNSKYVFYAFNDYEFLRIFSDKLQGSDQPYINLPELKSLLIPMCTIKEQSEIVSKLETILKLENYIANTGTSLLSRIDTMKKSILAKAFRGELGTNNPTEGSALNLLKEVLQDKF